MKNILILLVDIYCKLIERILGLGRAKTWIVHSIKFMGPINYTIVGFYMSNSRKHRKVHGYFILISSFKFFSIFCLVYVVCISILEHLAFEVLYNWSSFIIFFIYTCMSSTIFRLNLCHWSFIIFVWLPLLLLKFMHVSIHAMDFINSTCSRKTSKKK